MSDGCCTVRVGCLASASRKAAGRCNESPVQADDRPEDESASSGLEREGVSLQAAAGCGSVEVESTASSGREADEGEEESLGVSGSGAEDGLAGSGLDGVVDGRCPVQAREVSSQRPNLASATWSHRTVDSIAAFSTGVKDDVMRRQGLVG